MNDVPNDLQVVINIFNLSIESSAIVFNAINIGTINIRYKEGMIFMTGAGNIVLMVQLFVQILTVIFGGPFPPRGGGRLFENCI